MRISKNPEERRAELIAIAGKLFVEEGYNNVKVSDIVKQAKVAQGTYYYYFKTKQDVLVSVIESMIAVMATELKQLAENKQMTYTERFTVIMRRMLTPLDANAPIMKLVNNASETSHRTMDTLRTNMVLPIVTKLIIDGAAAGEFKKYNNHAEIVQIMFEGISSALHSVYASGQDGELYLLIQGFSEMSQVLLGIERMELI